MNKKKIGITNFVIITAIVVIGLILSCAKFTVPTTYYVYNGFLGAIETSTELDNNYLVVYNVESKEEDEEVKNDDINNAVTEMYDIFMDYISSYSDVSISRNVNEDGQQIQAIVPVSQLGTDFFDLFGKPVKLEIKASEDSEAESLVDNSDIDSVTYTSDGTNYGVYVTFDKKATQTLIQYSTSTLYYYIDGESASGQFINNSVFVAKEGYTAQDASSAAIGMVAAKLPVTLAIYKNATVTPKAGENAKLLIGIALLLTIAAYAVYMGLKFKMVGVCSFLSFAIFGVMYAFFLQSLPWMSLSLAGFFAIVASIMIFAVSTATQFTKMNEDYNSRLNEKYDVNRRLPVVVKSGFKKALLTVVDIHSVAFISGMMALLLGNTLVKSVALTLIVGVLISAFVTLLLNKIFVKWYLNINDSDVKKFGFVKEEK